MRILTHVFLSMRTLITTLLFMVSALTFGQVIHHNLQQYDANRIYVDVMTDQALKGFKPQSQYIGASITNKTNDKLYVEVEYWANLLCNPSRVSSTIKVYLEPGAISKADFWTTINSFDVVDRLTDFCKTEQLGLRRKIDENKYTWIASVGYQIIKIDNLTEKKRQEELERKQKDINKYIEQGDMYLKNKTFDNAIKHYESALALDSSNAVAKQKLQNAKSEKNKYQAEESKKKEEEKKQTQQTQSSTQTNSSSDFWDDRPVPTNTQTTQKSKEQIAKEKQYQEAKQKYEYAQNSFFDNMEKQKQITAKIEAFSQTSYYLAERKNQAERGVFDNASFNREFDNVEDLNRAFQQQVSQINASANELAEVKTQNLNNNLNYSLKDTDATTQAIGQGIALIGSIINNASAESDRKYALEKLEKERKAQIARIENERKQKILNLRNDIFKQYPEGGVPLSRHNINLEELYFFTYSQNADRTAVKVSNVFPYAKYQDGTWAFKDKVTVESEKATSTKVTLVGYYTSKELAEKERDVFIKLLPQAEVQVTAFEVKGRKQDGASSGNTDFWGNDTKTETKTTEAKKTDSFWDDASAKTDKKTETKKEDDFWD